jgi:hypothetical protein
VKRKKALKPSESRDALTGFVLVAAGMFDLFEGVIEQGKPPMIAAKRAWRRGKKRADAVSEALAKVEAEDP